MGDERPEINLLSPCGCLSPRPQQTAPHGSLQMKFAELPGAGLGRSPVPCPLSLAWRSLASQAVQVARTGGCRWHPGTERGGCLCSRGEGGGQAPLSDLSVLL